MMTVLGAVTSSPLPALAHPVGADAQRSGAEEGFTIRGLDEAELVSDAGDVNADGIADFIVGTFLADAASVVFGRSTGFPPNIALVDLPQGDGTDGFQLAGRRPTETGVSVSGAGDVNGDGIDDLIVGADRIDFNGNTDVGAAYVVFGRATGFPPSFDLDLLLPGQGGDGSAGFALLGIRQNAQTGADVGAAGDLNADGFDDLVVSSAREGHCYVVFGRTTGFPAIFPLASLLPVAGGDGSEGFVVTGIHRDVFLAMAAAGDVNGDGIDDFIIGAPEAGSRDGDGESYVIFGRASGFPPAFHIGRLYPRQGGDGTEGFVIDAVSRSTPFSENSGSSVRGIGDLNADGVGDIVVGARWADPHGKLDAGEAYVVFGRTTGFPPVVRLRSLFPAGGGDGSTGFVLEGIQSGDQAGLPVSGSGDINGDGMDDLAVAAPGAAEGHGHTYVIFGRTTAFPPVLEAADLLPFNGGDGSSGFVIQGIDNTAAGSYMSRAGDLNADGLDDLLIWSDPGPPTDEGYVVFGRTTGFPPLYSLQRLLPLAP